MQINRFDNQQTLFLDFIKSYCKEHDKKLSLRPSKWLVADGGRCSGWCDGEELRVASQHDLALEILVHEFSHMTQAVEEDPLWTTDHHDYSAVLDEWNNERHPSVTWTWAGIYQSILIERDCERRSLALIKRFNLPITRSKYISQANLYLQFYHYIFLKRRWMNSTQIYHPELLKLMPTDRLLPVDELENINMYLMREFDRVLGVK